MSQKTSLSALESVDTSAVREQVFSFIHLQGAMGATCWEAENFFTGLHQTISPRINELMEEGRVIDSLLRRRTGSGRMAIVWVVTDSAAVEQVKRQQQARKNREDRVRKAVKAARLCSGDEAVVQALDKLAVPRASGIRVSCCVFHLLGGDRNVPCGAGTF